MSLPKSTTRTLRLWNMILWSLMVVVALAGWLLGKDPGQLTGLIGFGALSVGIGEASNVGKRATFKKEAVELERES